MTDTERLEKLDLWMQENGWDGDAGRTRFMDEHFAMHIRDWIDSLPPHEHMTERTHSGSGDDTTCRYCGASVLHTEGNKLP